MVSWHHIYEGLVGTAPSRPMPSRQLYFVQMFPAVIFSSQLVVRYRDTKVLIALSVVRFSVVPACVRCKCRAVLMICVTWEISFVEL